MSDTRHHNVSWSLPPSGSVSFDAAQLAVLMDIREELQRLNRVMQCQNTLDIPNILRTIRKNTAPRRRKPTTKKRGAR
jgi:hypothetical protein